MVFSPISHFLSDPVLQFVCLTHVGKPKAVCMYTLGILKLEDSKENTEVICHKHIWRHREKEPVIVGDRIFCLFKNFFETLKYY